MGETDIGVLDSSVLNRKHEKLMDNSEIWQLEVKYRYSETYALVECKDRDLMITMYVLKMKIPGATGIFKLKKTI